MTMRAVSDSSSTSVRSPIKRDSLVWYLQVASQLPLLSFSLLGTLTYSMRRLHSLPFRCPSVWVPHPSCSHWMNLVDGQRNPQALWAMPSLPQVSPPPNLFWLLRGYVAASCWAIFYSLCSSQALGQRDRDRTAADSQFFLPTLSSPIVAGC